MSLLYDSHPRGDSRTPAPSMVQLYHRRGRESMGRAHWILTHLSPKRTYVTSFHTPLATPVTWPIQLQRRLGNAEELMDTDKHSSHCHNYYLPHLTAGETEDQRNGDMAQDLAASVWRRPIQPQACLPAQTTLLTIACS